MGRTFLDKQSSLLEKRPLVVGTLTGLIPLKGQCGAAKKSSIDLLEVRLDTFGFLSKDTAQSVSLSKKIISEVKKSTRLPILLTLRSHKEAGHDISVKRRFTDEWRWMVLRELIPLVSAVDVEALSGSLVKKVSALARKKNVSLILSHHNFKGVRPITFLKKLEKVAASSKADILKVAVSPGTDADLRSFLGWGLESKVRPVLIGMGPLGFISRFIGFSYGSALTYGHLGQSAAPGQIAAADLSRNIRSIYSQHEN